MQPSLSSFRVPTSQCGSWDPSSLMDIAAYVSVGIGYLVAVVANTGLTPLGLILQTIGSVAWLWLFWQLTVTDRAPRRTLLLTLAMIALTIAIEQLAWLGGGFDWLLPMVMVSVIAMGYPIGRALLLGGGIWLVTVLTLLGLDSGRSMISDLMLVVPGFIFIFGFSAVVRYQFELRERAEALVAQLEVAQEQLRAHAREAEELAVSRERNRMAREIHDTLGHYLTLLAVQLETALKLEAHGDARLHAELTEARRVATECLGEVRRSVAALRPADPTARSFGEALARVVAEFEAALPETEIVLDIEGPAQDLPPERRMALYRCAQESLTNVRKHAHATKVLVRLRVDDHTADLTVLDNGDAGATGDKEHEPGFGLLGMRERIALLGGTATAAPEPGHGWRVEVCLPLPPRLAAAPAVSAGELVAATAAGDAQ